MSFKQRYSQPGCMPPGVHRRQRHHLRHGFSFDQCAVRRHQPLLEYLLGDLCFPLSWLGSN